MCRRFEPTWDEVSSQFGSKVEFKRIDGEDPYNDRLKKKFAINGYPIIIFTDNSGQMLDRLAGAPKTAESFKSVIQRELAKYGE